MPVVSKIPLWEVVGENEHINAIYAKGIKRHLAKFLKKIVYLIHSALVFIMARPALFKALKFFTKYHLYTLPVAYAAGRVIGKGTEIAARKIKQHVRQNIAIKHLYAVVKFTRVMQKYIAKVSVMMDTMRTKFHIA